jgi:hypothetical protein
MNVGRLKKLRDFLATLPEEKFDMETWGRPICNSPRCIAGWAAWYFKIKGAYFPNLPHGFDETKVSAFFELEDSSLFLPETLEGRTMGEALQVLDHLIETGEVSWPEPEPE